MITKVTSANYDAYTLLFNQANAALKEYNGEPTTEFVLASNVFDPTVQYFKGKDRYEPVSFADAAEYEARPDEEDYFILNEQIIYDLDTYFGNLQALTDIDYGFLRMPIDEPTFDILDDSSNGRRVIKVPDDFAKNGISVQGDETAEILFFSIDRYYDATDLWTEGMHYIIQWKSATKNGVTKAFLNKNGRPFVDNGKLYFGWPISSEITDEPGNVTFSVRIFKFADNSETEEGKPKLAFGLNTQTATVKVNASLAFEIKSSQEFEDAITVNKNSDLIARVVNSTILSEGISQEAEKPEWNDGLSGSIDHNILTENVLATALGTKVINKDVYVLATTPYDENETYYNIDKEVVQGLNEHIYRAGIYYTKKTVQQTFYEFNYEDVKDKLEQVQAFVSSGVITYIAHSQATPEDEGIGGSFSFDATDLTAIYKPVNDAKKLEKHKYYEFDYETGQFKVALDIATQNGENWVEEDKNLDKPDSVCKYFERVSPLLVINENNPVGCYWIVAYNNEAKKIPQTIDSYKIWIPGPAELTDENVSLSQNLNELGQERILINNENKAVLSVTTSGIPANNDVKYEWSGEKELTDEATQELDYSDDNIALVDEVYSVNVYTERNKKSSDTKIARAFRVTAPAQPFVFDTVADTEGEYEHSTDKYKIVIHSYADYGDDAYTFDIDFSDNLDEDNNLKMVSDAVAYRFRKRVGGTSNIEKGIFANDIPADGYEKGNKFTLVNSYAEIPQFVAQENNAVYYCEVINIVNEDIEAFMGDAEGAVEGLNVSAEAVVENIADDRWWNVYAPRIARTPYFTVEY